MKTFIFRNNTIEFFFSGKDYSFSGYSDISVIPEDAESYIWWYQLPIKAKTGSLISEVESMSDQLSFILEKIDPNKQILLFTLADIYHLHFCENDRGLKQAISQYNQQLFTIGKQHNNVKVLEIEDLYSQIEPSQLIDWKYYFISQVPLNPKLAVQFRKWFTRKLNVIAQKRKKCLVLDLDNTLWSGVLGEDGPDGIKMDGDYPGKAFHLWQESLLELSKQGVLLTICSKNNEKDVLDLWANNPTCIINNNNVVSYRINWQDKATNIREIAAELNIGLDSLVFIDDNPTERELIKQHIPEVEVPEFPEQPYLLPVFFKNIVNSYFQLYDLTAEDKQKTSQYKERLERENEKLKFADMSDYLRSLEMKLTIEPANDYSIQRIAQMTQKTNQFNLTTQRYTETDIRALLSQGWQIYTISVSDKFGDNGITGAIFINGNVIENLLLSCRILGKGIEFAFVKTVLSILKTTGIQKIISRYIPSIKNMQTEEFYEKCGFELLSKDETGGKNYEIDLNIADLTIEQYYEINNK